MVAQPDNTLLLQQEANADRKYGFPSGTMAALGASESSQGTRLGSLGNIFQVLPSTAANPGYGLSGVNGNDPNSVGAYLSALINGPGGGSVASGLSLYQGRPAGSTGNNAMSSFLAFLAGGAPGGQSGGVGAYAQASGVTGTAGATDGLTGGLLRVLVAVLAIALIALGVAALALKSDPASIAAGAVGAVIP